LNVFSCVRASGCPDSSSSSSFVGRPQYQIRRGPLRVTELIEQCWVKNTQTVWAALLKRYELQWGVSRPNLPTRC
jgi:hypothetical protein